MSKKCWHSANSLSVLRYFDNLTKLFTDLYLAKVLDTLAKPFFLYVWLCSWNDSLKIYTAEILKLIYKYLFLKYL